jgi:peptidoglycan/LPS O-acetylase OafA/YrhL
MTSEDHHLARTIPAFPALDGVRALSVAAVLLYHGGVLWMQGGFLGVEAFFVLSGFLITSILWGELRNTGDLGFRRFYVRRARRLLPALFAMLIVTTTLFVLGWPGEIARIRADVAAAFGYVSNWYLIGVKRSYFESFGRPSPFGHLWSLAIEEQFYLIWPLVLVFLYRRVRRARRVAGWMMGGAAVSAVLMWLLYSPADPSRVYFGTDTRAAGLLIGSALAVVWRPWNRDLRSTVPAKIVFGVAGLAAAATLGWAFMRMDEFGSFTYRPGIQIVSLATAILIAVIVHPAGVAGRLLGWKPLAWIGRRSYSIYLWHWPVYVVTRPSVDINLNPDVVLAFRVLLTVGLAELSYRYVEQPIRSGTFSRNVRELAARVRAPRVHRHGVRTAWFGGTAAIIVCLSLLTNSVLSAPSVALGAGNDGQVSAASSKPVRIPFEKWDKEPPRPPIPNPSVVTVKVDAIGDSVMADARRQLAMRIPRIYVNALVGRQPSNGIDVLRALRKKNKLADVVVINLGTNGRLLASQFDEIMKVTAGVARTVVFVTVRVPRTWETYVNKTILAGVERYPDRAVLVDWHERWADCPGTVFSNDGVHLTLLGASCYAALIAGAIVSAS